MDGQLALPARMALLESVLPPTLAGCSPAYPAALCSSPLEEVRLTGFVKLTFGIIDGAEQGKIRGDTILPFFCFMAPQTF